MSPALIECVEPTQQLVELVGSDVDEVHRDVGSEVLTPFHPRHVAERVEMAIGQVQGDDEPVRHREADRFVEREQQAAPRDVDGLSGWEALLWSGGDPSRDLDRSSRVLPSLVHVRSMPGRRRPHTDNSSEKVKSRHRGADSHAPHGAHANRRAAR